MLSRMTRAARGAHGRAAAIFTGAAAVASGAMAQATATYDTTALATQITADIGEASGVGFDLLVLVLGASVGLGLIKRFVNKAT